jgi:hypothetical protein
MPGGQLVFRRNHAAHCGKIDVDFHGPRILAEKPS